MNWRDIYQNWRRYRAYSKTESEAMRSFFEQPQPKGNSLVNECDYLALDIETTGLSVANDDILSIAYVPIIKGKIRLKSARHMIVKSDASVGQSATIHNIHDHEVQTKGLAIEHVMETLLEDLAGKVLVVHYEQLDYGMLHKACIDLYQAPLLCPMIDTLAVELQRYKRLNAENIPLLQLDACRERYGLPRYRAHNAMIDAIATAELWLAQSTYIQGNKQLPLRRFS